MAGLTRKQLRALGVSSEAEDEIINAYQEAISDVKQQRDEYRDKAKDFERVTQELEKLKEQSERIPELESRIAKYEKAESEQGKKTALTALLESAGLDKRGFAKVLAATDLEKIELDADGKIKDSKVLEQQLKAEWADLVVAEHTEQATPETPNTQENDSVVQIEDVRRAMGLPV